jgi:hypothetical protein
VRAAADSGISNGGVAEGVILSGLTPMPWSRRLRRLSPRRLPCYTPAANSTSLDKCNAPQPVEARGTASTRGVLTGNRIAHRAAPVNIAGGFCAFSDGVSTDYETESISLSLLPTTREFLALVERETGYPVKVLEDPNLPTLASVRIARKTVPAHFLTYKPTRDESLTSQGFPRSRAGRMANQRWPVLLVGQKQSCDAEHGGRRRIF